MLWKYNRTKLLKIIFLKKKIVIHLNLQNNVFCYVLVIIIITDLPDSSTGIKILRASNSQLLKIGDKFLIDEEKTITGNKDYITRVTYKIDLLLFLRKLNMMIILNAQ